MLFNIELEYMTRQVKVIGIEVRIQKYTSWQNQKKIFEQWFIIWWLKVKNGINNKQRKSYMILSRKVHQQRYITVEYMKYEFIKYWEFAIVIAPKYRQ